MEKRAAITINERNLRKARLLCGVWPLYYGAFTVVAWAAAYNFMPGMDETRTRLFAALLVLTLGLSLAMLYSVLELLLVPLLELFRMSCPSGHYLVGQMFASPKECAVQNRQDTKKYRAAQALAQLLTCGKIGNFFERLGPAYEFSMIFCGFVLATVIPADGLAESLCVFSLFSACGVVSEVGRKFVVAHISAAGQIIPVQK